MKRTQRRAAVLLETVIAVTMLAVAVPVTVSWMQSVAGDRADATSSLRASVLATSIAEQIIADASSDAIGMDAMEDPSAYIDQPLTGLRARLESTLQLYVDAGFTYGISIGPLVGPEGLPTGEEVLDASRVVTITVRYPSSRTEALELVLEIMVTAA
jgi:hypothetical protein